MHECLAVAQIEGKPAKKTPKILWNNNLGVKENNDSRHVKIIMVAALSVRVSLKTLDLRGKKLVALLVIREMMMIIIMEMMMMMMMVVVL